MHKVSETTHEISLFEFESSLFHTFVCSKQQQNTPGRRRRGGKVSYAAMFLVLAYGKVSKVSKY